MATDVRGLVESYCLELHQVLDRLSTAGVQVIAQEILAAYGRGRQIFVFGNGGSAATASHVACDLGNNTAVHGAPRLCVHSLVDNTALITVLANDLVYEAIFSEQLLQAPLQAGDLVIAITRSVAAVIRPTCSPASPRPERSVPGRWASRASTVAGWRRPWTSPWSSPAACM
jgi:D-sedoheptulose 7-phosphate isomerase